MNPREQALNLLSEIHLLDPNRSFKSILGSYEKLSPNYITADTNVNLESYLKNLLSFYEFCKKYNDSILELDVCIAMAKNLLGMFYHIFNNDDNKAKQIFIEVVNSVGIEDFKDESINIVRNFAIERLREMGINKFLIGGKMRTVQRKI